MATSYTLESQCFRERKASTPSFSDRKVKCRSHRQMRLFPRSQPVTYSSDLLIYSLNTTPFLIPSVTEVIIHHLTHFCKILFISRTTTLCMKWSHLLLLLQLKKRYKEALFSSWARQSVPSSISTAAARRVFTKTSRCTEVSMGLASSSKDVNHRCLLPQALVWGEALHDL